MHSPYSGCSISVQNWYFCCCIVTYSWLPVNTRSECMSDAIANGRYHLHRPLVVYFLSYSDGTVRLSNTAISPSSFACLARLAFGVVSLIPNSFDLFCSTLDCCKILYRNSVCFASCSTFKSGFLLSKEQSSDLSVLLFAKSPAMFL